MKYSLGERWKSQVITPEPEPQLMLHHIEKVMLNEIEKERKKMDQYDKDMAAAMEAAEAEAEAYYTAKAEAEQAIEAERNRCLDPIHKVETPIASVPPIGDVADQTMRMNDIRYAIQSTYKLVYNYCPDGRARSLALTKLEEASMWAIKSIAFEGYEIEMGKV